MKALYLAVATLLVSLALSSCGTYRPVKSAKKDSIYAYNFERDSIYLKDSVYVYLQADTVFKVRDRTYYRDKVVRDTVYVTRSDTTTVVREVERRFTSMEKLKMDIGSGVLWAIPILISLYLLYRKLKK